MTNLLAAIAVVVAVFGIGWYAGFRTFAWILRRCPDVAEEAARISREMKDGRSCIICGQKHGGTDV